MHTDEHTSVIEAGPLGVPGLAPFEHCPHCEGAVPHSAITYEPLRRGGDAYSDFVTRRVRLDCPHCDRQSVIEIRERKGVVAR